MNKTSFVLMVAICVLNGNALGIGNDDVNERIRKAVRLSIPLLQKSCSEYLKHRECFSCHHQSLPILALTTAESNGYQVDSAILKGQVEHTLKHFKKSEKKYRAGQGTGGQVDTAGYGLWALHSAGTARSQYTDAVVDYLLTRDRKRDFWRRSSERPPSEASHFTATYVAILALQHYAAKEKKEAISDRIKKVKKWANETMARDNEDRVFKLLLAVELDFSPDEIGKLSKELLESQKEDGGWAQLAKMKSDSYATSTALYALKKSGRLNVKDESFQRGIKYLLDSQLEDGSWFVKSRSSPFQEYFESGFPHEKDQFISITATCWAISVLAEAAPLK